VWRGSARWRAGVYDGVFSAPGAVAPCALGGLEPVGLPSGPLVAPEVLDSLPVLEAVGCEGFAGVEV
jgi:hypothetical protein